MGDPILQQAQKRVKQKKDFFKHLAAFVGVGFFFFAMNMFTLVEEGPEIWFFFPLLPWSVGLIIHYFNVFGFPGTGALSPDWEAKEVQKEVKALRKKMGYSSPTSSNQEELELKEIRKEKATDWDRDDLV
jgi:hypothetical protein